MFHCAIILFKKKNIGSGGICIGLKKSSGRVSRYPFPVRDEVDSFNLRGGTIRAIYTTEYKKRPPYIRRVLVVLNKTRTSPYKRHI